MGVDPKHVQTSYFALIRRESERRRSKAFSKSVSGKRSKYKSKQRRYTNTKKEIEKRQKVHPRAGKNSKILL